MNNRIVDTKNGLLQAPLVPGARSLIREGFSVGSHRQQNKNEENFECKEGVQYGQIGTASNRRQKGHEWESHTKKQSPPHVLQERLVDNFRRIDYNESKYDRPPTTTELSNHGQAMPHRNTQTTSKYEPRRTTLERTTQPSLPKLSNTPCNKSIVDGDNTTQKLDSRINLREQIENRIRDQLKERLLQRRSITVVRRETEAPSQQLPITTTAPILSSKKLHKGTKLHRRQTYSNTRFSSMTNVENFNTNHSDVEGHILCDSSEKPLERSQAFRRHSAPSVEQAMKSPYSQKVSVSRLIELQQTRHTIPPTTDSIEPNTCAGQPKTSSPASSSESIELDTGATQESDFESDTYSHDSTCDVVDSTKDKSESVTLGVQLSDQTKSKDLRPLEPVSDTTVHVDDVETKYEVDSAWVQRTEAQLSDQMEKVKSLSQTNVLLARHIEHMEEDAAGLSKEKQELEQRVQELDQKTSNQNSEQQKMIQLATQLRSMANQVLVDAQESKRLVAKECSDIEVAQSWISFCTPECIDEVDQLTNTLSVLKDQIELLEVESEHPYCVASKTRDPIVQLTLAASSMEPVCTSSESSSCNTTSEPSAQLTFGDDTRVENETSLEIDEVVEQTINMESTVLQKPRRRRALSGLSCLSCSSIDVI